MKQLCQGPPRLDLVYTLASFFHSAASASIACYRSGYRPRTFEEGSRQCSGFAWSFSLYQKRHHLFHRTWPRIESHLYLCRDIGCHQAVSQSRAPHTRGTWGTHRPKQRFRARCSHLPSWIFGKRPGAEAYSQAVWYRSLPIEESYSKHQLQTAQIFQLEDCRGLLPWLGSCRDSGTQRMGTLE